MRRLTLVHRVFRFWWLILTCLALNVHAENDIISDRAVLEDASGMLSIKDVQNASFVPFDGMLTRGYSDSALWLRIVVTKAKYSSAIKLRIRPTFVDDVRLYEPDSQKPGAWSMRRTGDRTPFEASERGINSLGFVIHPKTLETTYYLRVQTSSSRVLSVEAVSFSQAERHDGQLVLLQIVYLCLVGWVMAWSVGSFIHERNAVPGWFAIFQASNILYALCTMGFFASLEPPQWPGLIDTLTSVFVITTTFLGLVFHRAVLLLYRPAPFWRWILHLLLPMMMLILGIFASGHERLALQTNAMLLPLLSLLFATISLTVHGADPLLPDVYLLRIVYILSFGTIVLTILPFFGWLQVNEWLLQANLLHGFIATGLMAYWMAMRLRLNQQHTAAEHAELVRTQYQLELEKKQADEQQRFIDILTHEIKTPLSVALISTGALKIKNFYVDRIRQALHNINSIIDRTRLSNLAEHKVLVPQVEQFDLTTLVHDCVGASTAPDRVNVSVGIP